ncbi:MAG: aminopeptidase N [Legionellales bacterium]|nr:aminopeptidase N [Legionellales bacterium]OUX64273.1 MAG: aminopeptidase N [Gammaproteobacteria bacterium TMED281]
MKEVNQMSMTPILLKNYEPHPFKIPKAELTFDLDKSKTIVTSILNVERNEVYTAENIQDLKLDGENLKLQSIVLNDKELTNEHYQVDDASVIIKNVPDAFTLQICVEISPKDNKALSGLYESSNNLCTQCESHGFRRMTYFIDRPDNLTCFTTHLIADEKNYPVLLSNGNCVNDELENGKRHVTWFDPTLKPSYLFAIVAGNFDKLSDSFTTCSEKEVSLGIFVEKGKLDQADFAMEALKRAMKWDEETYGREYDLNVYNVVGVSDFNYGAMENKGLNVFNSAVMLANPNTSIDAEYIMILRVIGHEYFHNWSGNRVTLKNWFQLSLKEGLTVFRDQHFTSDMTESTVQRINEVNLLKTAQFSEDAGPMAHPVRPHSYISMNNFYTATVYNKGAEVIGMIKTLLGPDTFRKGMDHYFDTNDGKSVTTDEFVASMEWAGGIDLSQFKRWYDQAGTPKVKVTYEYDVSTKVLVLHCQQNTPPTADGSAKEPFVIPLVIGFLNLDSLPVSDDPAVEQRSDSFILHFTMASQSFRFEHVENEPVLSLNRNFSAPIKIDYDYSREDLIYIFSNDTDLFNRWESFQRYTKDEIFNLYSDNATDFSPSDKLIDGLRSTLNELYKEGRFIACMFAPISVKSILMEHPGSDIVRLNQMLNLFYRKLAESLIDDMTRIFNNQYEYSNEMFDYKDIMARSLKSISLLYITLATREFNTAKEYFNAANTMTERWAALTALNDYDVPQRDACLNELYEQFKDDQLVVDKWFSLIARMNHMKSFTQVKSLLNHKAYNQQNPNNVRSLVGAFCSSVTFHECYEESYRWLSEIIISADKFNPQLATRLASTFIYFKLYDDKRAQAMIKELNYLKENSRSKDMSEVIQNALSQT